MKDTNKTINTFSRIRKSILHFTNSNVGRLIICLLIEAGLLWFIYHFLFMINNYIFLAVLFIDTVTLVDLYRKGLEDSISILWIVILFLMPFLGALMYFISEFDIVNIKTKKRLKSLLNEPIKQVPTKQFAVDTDDIIDLLEENSLIAYINNETVYFKNGELMFEDFLREVSKAKSFIFLEFSLVQNGIMWQLIQDVLIEKAKKGIDIKIIFDNKNDLVQLPKSSVKLLQDFGIHTISLRNNIPFLQLDFRNDYKRKLAIIDGNFAYVNGFDCSDELINLDHLNHFSKSSSIRLKGEAVKEFTLLFLHMYYLDKIDYSYIYSSQDETGGQNGLVVPIFDYPIKNKSISDKLSKYIIENSLAKIEILTPSILKIRSILESLQLAKSKGVNIRIITSKTNNSVLDFLAKQLIKQLIDQDIEVYFYQYGLIKSSEIIVDEKLVYLGEISNLFFKDKYSLNTGICLYDTHSLIDIKNDFKDIIGNSYKLRDDDFKANNKMTKCLVKLLEIIEVVFY